MTKALNNTRPKGRYPFNTPTIISHDSNTSGVLKICSPISNKGAKHSNNNYRKKELYPTLTVFGDQAGVGLGLEGGVNCCG